MPQDKDLQLLRPRRTAADDDQFEQTANDQVRKRPQHARPPTDGKATLPGRYLYDLPDRVTEFSNPTRRGSPAGQAWETAGADARAGSRSAMLRRAPARPAARNARWRRRATRRRGHLADGQVFELAVGGVGHALAVAGDGH